jgi:hypothetical protein
MKIFYSLLILISFFIISSAHSQQWQAIPNISGAADFVQTITASSNGDFYASVWGQGVFKSTNDGTSWSFSGMQGKYIPVMSVSPEGYIYALARLQTYISIYRSTNNGAAWDQVFIENLTNNYSSGGGIAFLPGGIILAAMNVTVGPTIGDTAPYLMRSTDNGASFIRTMVISGAGGINEFSVDELNNIYGSTQLAGIIKSTNAGTGWQNAGVNFYTYSIIYNRDAKLTALLPFEVRRSTDRGATWFESTSLEGYPRTMYRSALGNFYLSMPTNSPKIRFSNNDCSSWSDNTTGFTAQSVYCFCSNSRNIILAGSNNGIFKKQDVVTSVTEHTTKLNDYQLTQNFPNPFNPSTEINYNIGRGSFINVSIFDITGKKITELVNAVKPSGSYTVLFNADNISSGIYYYQLSINGIIKDTKKMTLLR